MSVYVRQQVILSSSTDLNEQNSTYRREDKALTSQTETFETEQSGEPILAASEANYVLPMGKVVTGRVLYIESVRELTVKLNGAATGFKVGPPSTGTKGRLYLRGVITSVSVTNDDAVNEAEVSYFIAGSKS